VATVPSSISWSDDFALNLPEIDAQHQVLFGLFGELWNAIVARAGQADMLRLIADLDDYAVQHFKEEEAFMTVTGFPRLEGHKMAHETFVRRVAAERLAIEKGSPNLSLDLLRFLRDWLVEHIMVSDREYARYYETTMPARAGLGGFFNRLARAAE
jgi:hemerythrin